MTQGGSASTNPGNFANRPKEEVKAIASKGGKASSTSAENNPGNFANRPREEVQAIASKGGKSSHGGGNSGSAGAGDDEYVPEKTQSSGSGNQGGSARNNPGNFANRDKDEVREIASKGGRASGAARSSNE